MNFALVFAKVYAQLAFLLLLPMLVATGCAVVWRKQLDHPLVFFVVACVVLYALYMLLAVFFPPSASSSAPIWRAEAGVPTRSSIANSFLGERWKLLAAFAVLAVPAMWGLLHWFSRASDA
jgi:hypothetical protein